MEAALKVGLTKAIGVSNFPVDPGSNNLGHAAVVFRPQERHTSLVSFPRLAVCCVHS